MRSNNQHLNRNKLSNAVAMLLKMEFNKNSSFKDLILDRELIEEEEKQEPMVASDAQEEEPTEMMIDTTSAGVEKAKKESEEKQQKKLKETQSKKRSDSIKLQLLLIGATRLIASEDSKNKTFVVHLLKGMLFKDDYFKKKGSTILKKQADLEQESEKEMQPPLVEIMSISDQMKEYISDLEVQIQIEVDDACKAQLKKEQE